MTMKKLYALWAADTGWNGYTTREKLTVAWAALSFIAMILSAGAASAWTFTVSVASLIGAAVSLGKNVNINE
jgi:hypothetical protein